MQAHIHTSTQKTDCFTVSRFFLSLSLYRFLFHFSTTDYNIIHWRSFETNIIRFSPLCRAKSLSLDDSLQIHHFFYGIFLVRCWGESRSLRIDLSGRIIVAKRMTTWQHVIPTSINTRKHTHTHTNHQVSNAWTVYCHKTSNIFFVAGIVFRFQVTLFGFIVV